jgi:HPr kinase/phosphorylase
MEDAGTRTVHATCVSHHGHGALIVGKSGSGKSGLALQLMAMGAQLVADDRVTLTRQGDYLLASCPPRLSGKIEARGVGLLATAPAPPTRVVMIVDLDHAETERLPPRRKREVLGLSLDLVFPCTGHHFPAALLLYLAQGERLE